MCAGGVIERADLSLVPSSRRPVPVEEAPKAVPRPRRSAVGRDAVVAALREHGQNVTAAAAALGVSRVTFYRMLQRFDVALDRTETVYPIRPRVS